MTNVISDDAALNGGNIRHRRGRYPVSVIARAGDWALGADALQWVLYREGRALSFVSSEKDILARCMREKGCPEREQLILLAGLPATFRGWRQAISRGPEGQCGPRDLGTEQINEAAHEPPEIAEQPKSQIGDLPGAVP